VTVDSDWLQLLRPSKSGQGVVDWLCAKGYNPQFRSIRDGSLACWLSKKFNKSKKKLGHLDPHDPQSIVEWKVIMGDKSDMLAAGEKNREMIDLMKPPEEWDFVSMYPDFTQHLLPHFHRNDKRSLPSRMEEYSQYALETGSVFPTRFCYDVPAMY
jgi:hypothetical protein